MEWQLGYRAKTECQVANQKKREEWQQKAVQALKEDYPEIYKRLNGKFHLEKRLSEFQRKRYNLFVSLALGPNREILPFLIQA